MAPGLTALDLIRQTLDRYLSGMKAYGLVGYVPSESRTNPYEYTDTYPSLLIAARDYVDGKDTVWLKNNYSRIRRWAVKLLVMDQDDDGLIEYPVSGNSGIWDKKFSKHAANWWDDIGFGHKDAYANALAYDALLDMAQMAQLASRPKDARFYTARAQKLRSVNTQAFVSFLSEGPAEIISCPLAFSRNDRRQIGPIRSLLLSLSAGVVQPLTVIG